jgi:hypothetical protein
MSNDTEVSSSEKQEALQQLVNASLDNNSSIWAKVLKPDYLTKYSIQVS